MVVVAHGKKIYKETCLSAMVLTEHVGDIPVTAYKPTKIVATGGPATDSYEQIFKLIKAGANGLRLNFSHGTHEEHAQRVEWIRQASEELDKPVAIIQDLQGPKIRLGDFEGEIAVQKGGALRLAYEADYEKTGQIPIQYDLSKKVKPGERLYLYDGRVRTVVDSVRDGIVYTIAENGGVLVKRKGINLPDTDLGGDIITSKDKKDLAFGSTLDIDYVAQSFVQTADDLRAMRRLIRNHNMHVGLIVKFETRSAVDHMEEIVQEADAIMIARGDLAGETSAETVPVVQNQLIGLGLQHAKPTIVATQMMVSMTESPSPTRAEVSDVATAVMTGADCVMLSEETAAGKYPIETVKTMKRIILRCEHELLSRVSWPEREDHSRQGAISRAVIRLADNIQAKAIVAETKSGSTARHIASWRPALSIIAVTSDVRTAQQLAIVYSVKSYIRPVDSEAAIKLIDWLGREKVFKAGDVVVTASGRYPGVVGTTDTIKVRVIE